MTLASKLRSARAIYAYLNRRYFNGKLERVPLHVIEGWGPRHLIEKDAWGITYSNGGKRPSCEHEEETCVYFAARLWDDMKTWLRTTILHEMIHVKTGVADHSSPTWCSEVERISKLGGLAATL
jgi:hypothetical protein